MCSIIGLSKCDDFEKIKNALKNLIRVAQMVPAIITLIPLY